MFARYIICFLFGAIVSSAWWAAAVFGYGSNGLLWFAPIVSTIITVALLGAKASDHWNDGK
jgi:hypothetical protein